MIHRLRPIALFAAAPIAAAALLAAACGGGGGYGYGNRAATSTPPRTAQTAQTTMASTPTAGFTLASDAFADNAGIPLQYTCDGDGASPALTWSGAPADTKAFALIMDDPDAPLQGGFTHWVAYDIPAGATALAAAVPAGPGLPGGGKQGANGAGRPGYTGPCPPPGNPAHHYIFRLYALDAPLGLDPAKSKADVLAAMQGHILGQAQLIGLFQR